MMKFLRSQSQTVLWIFLGVIALGFLFYGSAGNPLAMGGGRAGNDFGRIDGEDLSIAELYDAVRLTKDGLILQGQAQRLNQPGMAAQVAEEAWGQLLLLREADRLHIEATDQQVTDVIRADPAFQKDGVFNFDVYVSRMAQLKDYLHTPSEPGVDAIAGTEATYEKIVRNDLLVQAVRNALFSPIRSSAGDVSAEYQKRYGPATVTVATIAPKTFIASAQVTPEEIAAAYKAHPENPAYRTPEKRKVDYVLFMLTPDQQKLPDKDKAAAKDALGEKALDFALALQPNPDSPAAVPDFFAEAKQQGLTPATTDFFAADTPPSNLPPSPSFNNAAFALTQQDPVSRVVELDNGVAVLHLAEIQPSDLRPLDEVKTAIAQQLQETKGRQNAELTAQIMAKTLQAAVAKGADFKTALGDKVKMETLPPFVPQNVSQSDQRMQTIAYEAYNLAPGQVSDPVPIETDGTLVIVHLDSRAMPDPAGLADFENQFRQTKDQQLQREVSIDWINWKSNQPGTHKPPDLDAYGGVE